MLILNRFLFPTMDWLRTSTRQGSSMSGTSLRPQISRRLEKQNPLWHYKLTLTVSRLFISLPSWSKFLRILRFAISREVSLNLSEGLMDCDG